MNELEERNPNTPETVSDDRLHELLQALPRERAGRDFTAKVMRRLAESPPASPSATGTLLPFPAQRRRLPGWSGWLVAAAALLLVGLGLREWQHQRELEESMRRIAELRGQFQELASELKALREEAAARPVVYLGGNENVDLVLDLGHLAEARKNPASADPESRRKAREELEKLYREGGSRPLY